MDTWCALLDAASALFSKPWYPRTKTNISFCGMEFQCFQSSPKGIYTSLPFATSALVRIQDTSDVHCFYYIDDVLIDKPELQSEGPDVIDVILAYIY